METGGSSSQVIPASVLEALKRTNSNIDEVKANLDELLSYYDAENLSAMAPLERAQALLLISTTTATLSVLMLRCNGINPDDHPVKKELERLSLYEEKLQQCIDLSKAPLHPSETINTQAAARFIEHSLPDLSLKQKKSTGEISRAEGNGFKYLNSNLQKKRKYLSSEKQSVRSAAQKSAQSAPPVRGVRRENGRWRFDGEKDRKSPLLVQNLLTKLGLRIERHSYIDSNGDRQLMEFAPSLNLKEARMAILVSAAVLKMRNGADIAAVIYLAAEYGYENRIEVLDSSMKAFLKGKISEFTANNIVVQEDADCDSESEAYFAGINKSEVDCGGRSSDSEKESREILVDIVTSSDLEKSRKAPRRRRTLLYRFFLLSYTISGLKFVKLTVIVYQQALAVGKFKIGYVM